MKNFSFSWERFFLFPIVGILRGFSSDVVREIAVISLEEGLSTIEVALNTEGALEQISNLSESYGSRMNIGAGTVLSLEQLDKALEAGASFIVMPVSVKEVIQRCRQLGIPNFPGAFTPNEVFQAWQWGADMVKLFPANQGGPDYIKAIKAPLSDVKILATGGVNLDNLSQYQQAGADGFGIGSLFHPERMNNRDWDWFRQQIGLFKKILQKENNLD